MPTDCEAVILAGGLGTRMREISKDAVSKVLLPLAGTPVIAHVLGLVAREGMTDVLLCVGHKGDSIVEYCGDGSKWGLRLGYSVEMEPLGTGGAVIHALGMVRSASILVLNGDTLLEGGLRDMVDLHVAICRQPVLGVVCVDDRSRYGSVTVDQEGTVTAFGEKAGSSAGMIYAGCCVLPISCLAEWRSAETDRPLSLERDILPVLVRRGTVRSQLLRGFFLDTGTPEDYRRAGALYDRHE